MQSPAPLGAAPNLLSTGHRGNVVVKYTHRAMAWLGKGFQPCWPLEMRYHENKWSTNLLLEGLDEVCCSLHPQWDAVLAPARHHGAAEHPRALPKKTGGIFLYKGMLNWSFSLKISLQSSQLKTLG